MALNKTIYKKLLSALLTCTILILSISGCSMVQNSEPISRTGFYFDTIIQITLYNTTDEALLDECMNMCDHYEKLLSAHIDDSDVSKINTSNGQPVEVSDETIELLNIALEYAEISEGAFDPTIGSVSLLWDFDSDEHIVPDESTISEALTHVNYHNISINGNTVTISDPDTNIDLGAIAKGYIADKLKAYLVSENITSGIINLGGNVLLIGSKPDGSDFNIGIQKPFADTSTSITGVKASNKSVVSSGTYERYFEVDGKFYHHILDTSTGYPLDNGLIGITILSDDSVVGDALSTTCFSLGMEKGMELIESLDGIEVLFITEDYEIHTSSGWPEV